MTERDIFFEALEIAAPEARAAYLQGACGRDVTLRRNVDELLKEHFSKDSLLAGPAVAGEQPTIKLDLASEEVPAQMLGHYKLLEKIGEGGFGEVWMAEQREPVKRRVALKIIKLGMDSRQIVARFEAERQALAMMDHPNIAKIFDAGTTESPHPAAGHPLPSDGRGAGGEGVLQSQIGNRKSEISQGRPYFVMELVRGIKITEYCDQNQLPTRERLKLFILVCQAIQHAHQKGIIHRDIKPSNILVTLHDGVPVPKVIDFGIAKATQQELTDKTVFTQFQQFIGTPAYISPEQAEMSGLDIDTRADIYSLGVLLYELLVGQTPFDAKEMMQGGLDALRQIIREKEPLRPSTRLTQELVAADVSRRKSTQGLAVPTLEEVSADSRRRLRLKEQIARVRGDLDWIVMKCLEKDRTRRYDTANGLAMDIQRHINDEAVLARPPSAAYRFQKLVRRNKLAFAAAAAVACALVLGLVVSTWQAVRATNAEQAEKAQAEQARADRDRAVRAEGDSRIQAGVAKDAWATVRRNAYAAEINVAFQALAENNLARALDLLNRQRPMPGEEDLRGFEWRYLWQLCRPDEKVTFRGESAYEIITFSPDGKWLAYASDEIFIREVASQAVVAKIPSPATTLAFSPRAKLLASGYISSVRLWSTESWEEVRSLPGARHAAVFSPDGQWLVTGADGGYRVWNTETWEPAGFCAGVPELIWHLRQAVAFSPDGKLLVTPGHPGGRDAGQFQVWDFPSLTVRSNFTPFPGFLGSAVFAPDGKHLLTGRWDGVLLVWNVAEGKVVDTLNEHTGWITAITFARDGKTFATASCDRTLIVWDTATRRPLVRLRGHLGEIESVAMSPDGRALASCSSDEGTTKLWDTTTRHEGRELAGFAMAIGFSADSRRLLVRSRDEVSLWHLADGATTTIPLGNAPELYQHRSFATWADVHRIEPFAVLGRLDGVLEVWNLATRSRVVSWPAHNGEVTAAVFSPDGRLIATGGANGDVTLWEAKTGRNANRLEAGGTALLCLAFSPDGRLLAGAGDSSRVRVWDAMSGRLVLELVGHRGTVPSVAFSPDGKLLATCDLGNTARLWDVPSGKLRATLKGHIMGVWGVAFTPDGKTLATGSDDRKVKLWNIATEQEVATLPLPGGCRSLRFSPDGRTLAVGYVFGTKLHLWLWQSSSFEEIAAAESKEKAEIQRP